MHHASMSPDIELLRYAVLALQRQGSRHLSGLFGPLGLTPSQAEVLGVLRAHQPLSVKEVGGYLVCESGSPSRLIGSLVERGLVGRGHDARDRRSAVLELTPRGAEVAAQVAALEQGYHQALETGLRMLLSVQGPARAASGRTGSADGPDRHEQWEIGDVARLLSQAVVDPSLRGALARRFPEVADALIPRHTA